MDLADEIVNAAKSNANALGSLQRNSAVAAYEEDYWAAMSNGTQESYGTIYNGLGVMCLTAFLFLSPRQSSFLR